MNQRIDAAVRVIVFAKAPRPGRVKTRLAPALGEQGAARLAKVMLETTLGAALRADCGEVMLCAAPALDNADWMGWRPPAGVADRPQGEGDLGQRLAQACRQAFADGCWPLLVGTDCPALDAKRLRAAASALKNHDLVVHGTHDGGYALLGLSRPVYSVFQDIDWSTERVLAQTVARARQADCDISFQETLRDIDDPEDLGWLPEGWRAVLG